MGWQYIAGVCDGTETESDRRCAPHKEADTYSLLGRVKGTLDFGSIMDAN